MTTQETKFISLAKAEIALLDAKLQMTAQALDEDKAALDNAIKHLEMMGEVDELNEKYNVELKGIAKQQELAKLAYDEQLKIFTSLTQQIADLKQHQETATQLLEQKSLLTQKETSEERLAQYRAYQSLLIREDSRQALFRMPLKSADMKNFSTETQKVHSEIEINFQKQHEVINQNLLEIEKRLLKENERLTELQETANDLEKQRQAVSEKIHELEEKLKEKNHLSDEVNQHQELLKKSRQEVESQVNQQAQEEKANAERLVQEKKQSLLDEKNKIKKILEDYVVSEEEYFIKQKSQETLRQSTQEKLIKEHHQAYEQCMERLRKTNSSLENLLLEDKSEEEITFKRQELQEAESALLDLTTKEQQYLEQQAEDEKHYLAEIEFHAKQSKKQKDQYFTELQLIAASLAEFNRTEEAQLVNATREMEERTNSENKQKLATILEQVATLEKQQQEVGKFILDDQRFISQLHKEHEKLNDKNTLTLQALTEQQSVVNALSGQKSIKSDEQKKLEKNFFQEKQSTIAKEQQADQQQIFKQELLQEQDEFYVRRLSEQQALVDKAVQTEQLRLAELEKQWQQFLQKMEEDQRVTQKALLDLDANKQFSEQLLYEQESLVTRAKTDYENIITKQQEDITNYHETTLVFSNQKKKLEERIKAQEQALLELKDEKEKLDAQISVESTRLNTLSSVVSQPEKERMKLEAANPPRIEQPEVSEQVGTSPESTREMQQQDSPSDVIRQKIEAMRNAKTESKAGVKLSDDAQAFKDFIAEMTRRKNKALQAQTQQQTLEESKAAPQAELGSPTPIESAVRSEPKSTPQTELRPDIIAYKALIEGIKTKKGFCEQAEVPPTPAQSSQTGDEHEGLRADIAAFEQIALSKARSFASSLSFLKKKTSSESVTVHTVPTIEPSPSQSWVVNPKVHSTPPETELSSAYQEQGSELSNAEQNEVPQVPHVDLKMEVPAQVSANESATIPAEAESKETEQDPHLEVIPKKEEPFSDLPLSSILIEKDGHSDLTDYKKPLYEDLDFIAGSKKAILSESSPWSNLLLYGVILFFIVGLIWAHYAIVDQTIVAEGKVIPSTQVYDVQSLDGGVLAELYVKEGQKIEKGQLLLRIDNKRFGSSYQETEIRKLAIMGEIARLAAESMGMAAVTFPEEVKTSAPDVVAQQTKLFQTRKDQLAAAISTTQRSYDLAAQELKITQPLVKEGLMSQLDLLRLQREINQLRGEMQTKNDQFRTDAQQQLSTKQAELAPLLESVKGLKDRSDRTTLTSPIAGVVKKIYLNPGEVVEPAKNVLEVVPTEDSLLIEAKVKPVDIGYVHINDNTVVKVSAYDYSIYGSLEGKVIYVSPDSIQSDKNPDLTYYIIRVRTQKSFLVRNNQRYSIIPGMTVVTDIKGAKKSVLDYLLKPFLKTKEEALREH